jgi:hypothetical protein
MTGAGWCRATVLGKQTCADALPFQRGEDLLAAAGMHGKVNCQLRRSACCVAAAYPARQELLLRLESNGWRERMDVLGLFGSRAGFIEVRSSREHDEGGHGSKILNSDFHSWKLVLS